MADTANYLKTLQAAIQKTYGRKARHVESVPIQESFQGKVVWKGVVEVFDLVEHSLAKRAYAWGHAARDTGNEVQIVTILGVSPIDSPLKAVQVSILADVKRQQN